MGKKIDISVIRQAVEKFRDKNILVVGDIMLDRFIWGGVSRISPEAPVPVVKVTRESRHLGGAGNVVNNLVALGAKCSLVGVIGEDSSGKAISAELNKKNVDTSSLVKSGISQTIQKIRIIAGSQQIARVDREDGENFGLKLEGAIEKAIKAKIKNASAVIISDYGKGVISRKIIGAVITHSKKLGIPVVVDPKIEHFLYYKNVTCITPNLKEAMEGMFFRKIKSEDDIVELGRKILKKLKSDSVLITRGENGMSLFEKSGRISHIPTVAREVYDVTGAGDTVISVFTLAYVSGLDLFQSAYLSNIAGGIVVGKVGTATTSVSELIDWTKKI